VAIKICFFLLFFLSACSEPLNSRGRPFRGAEQDTGPPLGISHAPKGISYTTVAEVLKRPTLFDGQQVRVRGRVAGVHYRSSRNEGPSTSFGLEDKEGNVVKVVIAARTSVQEGQEVMVEGRPVLLQSSSFADVVMTDARIVSDSSRGNSLAPTRVKSPSGQGSSSRPTVPRQRQPASRDPEGPVF